MRYLILILLFSGCVWKEDLKTPVQRNVECKKDLGNGNSVRPPTIANPFKEVGAKNPPPSHKKPKIKPIVVRTTANTSKVKDEIVIIPKKKWSSPDFCKDFDKSDPEKRICELISKTKKERKK